MKHWIAAFLKQKCTRMHQILFQFPFFPGVTHGPPQLGALPRPPGRRGRGWYEMEGQDREKGWMKGEEGEGKGRGKFASLLLGG